MISLHHFLNVAKKNYQLLPHFMALKFIKFMFFFSKLLTSEKEHANAMVENLNRRQILN